MLTSYLKTAFRNLVKHKMFTWLNILGLATGMACSILIFLWVKDETSYDRFNAHAASIYRMTTRISDIDAAVVPVPMATASKANIPEVVNATRISSLHSIVTVNTKKFSEDNMYYADSNFLRIFSYPLLQGDVKAALQQPDGVVLTEDAAVKYFGSASQAMGKTLHVDDDVKGNEYRVTGVLQKLPANSHLQFTMLLPIQAFERTLNSSEAWDNFATYTYLQLSPSFKPTAGNLRAIERQLTAMHNKATVQGAKADLFLQPLVDVHLHSRLFLDVNGQGNGQYVTIFSLVAIFILLIACINFMNLSTALSSQRAKEVGLRKTVGALRSQLVIQFISEAVLLSFISLVAGLLLASVLLPFFNALAAKSISLNLLNFNMIAALLGTMLLVGLVSGSYPALYLSSFQPVKVLKGVKMLHGKKTFFRNGLVIVQFSISVVLMVSTLVVYNQLKFIRTRDMGFNQNHLLYIKLPAQGDLQRNNLALKAQLSSYPGDYTISSHLPTYLTTGTADVLWENKDPKQQNIFSQLWVDEHFIQTFGMHLAYGRFFSKAFRGDDSNYVLNETALRIMKMDPAHAIGKRITLNERTGQIIGVVKDFNFKPVQQPIDPLIMGNGSSGSLHNLDNNGGYLVMRTSAANVQATIAIAKKTFDAVYNEMPFSYGFINEDISKLYLAEQRMGKLFNVFSVLSVIVSCLGLFGLATFATQKRIKEIGVRKVLGASTAGIVGLLSKDFVRLVAFALLIAFPAAWFVMNKWLENFVYRISISWWMFAVAGAIAIVIAFITVGYQSFKAASSNPTQSLTRE